MNLLSDAERARLYAIVKDAPDDILFGAAFATVKHNGVVSKPPPTPAAMKSLEELDKEPVVIKPVAVPPGEACSRIGADTRAAILKVLASGGLSAVEINTLIKRGPSALDSTVSLLKLLWVRGDIVFDGANYLVKS